MTRDAREKLLDHIPQSQKADAIRKTLRTKNQRRQTVNNLPKERVNEVIELAKRALMKGLLLRGSTSRKVDSMMRKSQKAQAALHKIQKETEDLAQELDPAELESISAHRWNNMQDSQQIRFTYVSNQAWNEV